MCNKEVHLLVIRMSEIFIGYHQVHILKILEEKEARVKPQPTP
jgi:hypothetical protein